ncbi:hypothetical protein QQF64_029033 [Cirrhinus molitorella]|uniref:Ermin n=1 Tax=Cirrhinus molitorella TaxID=172907 RepID=A0ABR3N8U6_9TELE
MNGQTEEVPQETTTPKEPVNNSDKNEQEVSENNTEKNEDEISGNNEEQNEEENAKEDEEEIEEEEDELADDFQPSVEMSIRQFEMDKNYRPINRYNTVSYRKIKRGNTKQRIDEFELLDV